MQGSASSEEAIPRFSGREALAATTEGGEEEQQPWKGCDDREDHRDGTMKMPMMSSSEAATGT